MTINPFATIEDYAAMLNKIAVSTLVVAVLCTAFLYWQVPVVTTFLGQFSYSVPIDKLEIPVGILVPGLLVALISRVFKLHDRMSDLLGIRARFDVEAILLPMAIVSGATLSTEQISKLRTDRKRLMGEAFYKYAKSTNPVIDKHYVTMALDQWSWYWMLLEAATVISVTGILLLYFANPTAAAWTELIVLASMWLLVQIRTVCANYALDEVREIFRDDSRKREIAQVFGAL